MFIFWKLHNNNNNNKYFISLDYNIIIYHFWGD
jgi:hypothetical protein